MFPLQQFIALTRELRANQISFHVLNHPEHFLWNLLELYIRKAGEEKRLQRFIFSFSINDIQFVHRSKSSF